MPISFRASLILTEHDPAVLRELDAQSAAPGALPVIEAFIADAPRLLAWLEDGLARGDPKILEQAAHAMKASCAIFGAQALAALCQRLESLGASGVITGAAAPAAQAVARFGRLLREMEALARERQV